IEELAQDCGKRFSLGPGIIKSLSIKTQAPLVEFYHETHPDAQVCSRSSMLGPISNFLHKHANFHTFLVLNGWRITPSASTAKAPNSIVQIQFDNILYVGQVVAIILHSQSRIDNTSTVIHVHWFRRLQDVNTTAWDPYPELEIGFWEYNAFLQKGEDGPPPIIPPSLIKSQACCVTVTLP
ncbi:hypothetical protein M0805_000189, partial [Coniferiporia weirii]